MEKLQVILAVSVVLVSHLSHIGQCLPPSGGMQWGRTTHGYPVADDEVATLDLNEPMSSQSDSTGVMTDSLTTSVNGDTSEVSTLIPETSLPTIPVLGGQCVNVSDCAQVLNSTCKDHTCQCKEDFYQLKGTCLKNPEIDLTPIKEMQNACEKLNGTVELCIGWKLGQSEVTFSDMNVSVDVVSEHTNWTAQVSEMTKVASDNTSVQYRGVVRGLMPGTSYMLRLTAVSNLWSVTTSTTPGYCTAPVPPKVVGHTSEHTSVNISLTGGAETPRYSVQACLASPHLGETDPCSDADTRPSYATVKDLTQGGHYRVTVATEFCGMTSEYNEFSAWTVPEISEMLVDCHTGDCETSGEISWWLADESYADEFRVTGSNGLNCTVPWVFEQFTYSTNADKLSPGLTYHFTVEAIVKTGQGVLKNLFEDDYTTLPPPAVIKSHRIVDEKSVILELSTRIPLNITGPYMYKLLYCLVVDHPTECSKDQTKKVNTPGPTYHTLEQFHPFGKYNISVTSAVFGEVVEEVINPKSAWIFISLEPNLWVAVIQWKTIRADQIECYGLQPMTQACVQWSLSFNISAPINITVYSKSAITGSDQSAELPGGQNEKGENLYRIEGLSPGLAYNFTVVIMSGLWRNEKTTQIYYTYPSSPDIMNQTSADTTSVTLSLNKTSHKDAEEEYEARLCDTSVKDCKDSWTEDNLKLKVQNMMLTITGLNPSTKYNISLRAVIVRGDNSKLVSQRITSKIIYTAPLEPSSPSFQQESDNLRVTWKNSHAPRYRLTWGKSEETVVNSKKCTSTCQTVLNKLQRGMVYNFTLFAFNGVARSTGNSVSYPMAPANPHQGKTARVTERSIKLEWSFSGTGAEEFLVQVCDIRNPGDTVNITLPMQPSSLSTYTYNKTDLMAGHTYNVSVRSVIRFGDNSVVSPDPPLFITNSTRPLAPSNFTPIKVAPTALSFVFTNNSLADQYLVRVEPQGERVKCRLTSAQGDEVRGKITGLSPGTDYTLTLTAESGVWSSQPYTVTISTNETVPGPPSNLSLAFVNSTVLQVQWLHPLSPNGHLKKYHVKVWEQRWYTQAWSLHQDVMTNLTQFTSDTLVPGQCYSVSVSAENGAGVGKSTDNTTLATPETAPSPPKINISKNGAHTVQVSWLRPTQPNGIIRNYTVSARDNQGKILQKLCFQCCDCPQDLCTTGSDQKTTADACSSVKKLMAGGLAGHCDKVVLYKLGDENLSTAVLGLHAYAHYCVGVEACTRAGCQQAWEDVDTQQDAPTAPLNVKAVAVSSTSIFLNWSLPVDQNGVIHFYEITYRTDGSTPEDSMQQNTTSNVTSFTVSKLSKWTNYTFSVRGFTNKFGNSSVAVTCRTLEDVPSTKPYLHVEVLNASAVELSWKPPKEANGLILKYNITLHSRSASDTNKTRTYSVDRKTSWIIISGLQYWSDYKVYISARTSVGQGPSAVQEFKTHEYAPTSPPENLRAISVNATAIHLTWLPPSQPNGHITQYDVTYTADKVPRDEILCVPRDKHGVVVGHLNYWTQYSFVVTASTAQGVGPPATQSERTKQYVPTSPVTGIKAVSKTSQSVYLKWSPPITPNGIIMKYTITYTSREHITGSNRNVKLSVATPDNQPQYNLTRLHQYWWYTVTVQAFTVMGQGKNNSEPYKVQTAEAVPGPPEDVKPTPVNSTSVKLSWKPPTFPNGEIMEYTIYHNQSKRSHRVKSDQNSVVIGGLKIWTVYNFTISARTKAGAGQRVSVTCRTKEAAPAQPDVSMDKPLIQAARNIPLSDPHTQAAITLPMQFFTDHTRGEPLAWGIIVIEASIKTLNHSKLTYISGRVTCQECVTWEEYHDKGVRKPYRATPDTWSPSRLNLTYSAHVRQRRATEEPAFILGQEGRCADTVFCNGYLKPGTQYRVKAFVCNLGGCTDTYYSHPVSTVAIPPDRSPRVAGAVIAVLFLLAIAGVVIYMKRTKRGPFGKKGEVDSGHVIIEETSDSSAELEMVQRSRPIKLSELESTVLKLKRSSNLGFADEYKDLKELSPKHPHHAADLEVNRSKNRYTNILPFDHSRVKLLPLDDEDGSDYINANYIPGYNSKREYIASQGPLPGTKDDFWRMIWEQNVSLIVMVTKCMEGRGRVKCEQYWPNDDEPVYFGELIVQRRSESILPEYDIRILDIKLGTVTHTVRQCHMKIWPDFGCPQSPQDLLTFHRAVRKVCPRSMNAPPILVHCSAGVGRTGTYIAVDCLLQQMRDHQEIDIFGRVLEMREHRSHMVQTEDQYVYIHDCAVDAYNTLQAQGEENIGYEEEENIYENMIEGPKSNNVVKL
ncbi:phosphatidylinositol phosphatase PTPRQ-like [Liolophura sinensis]|uniref:phosphatidylinositol phosphatase PTPRQ-like n=1 Tax=Liolophura sinensis TaxID=3198878 RepID=UPI003158A770